MRARDTILSALGDGLGGSLPDPWEFPKPGQDLFGTFCTAFEACGGRIVTADRLALHPERTWCVTADAVPLPESFGRFEPAEPWNAAIGVTSAVAAIAETGSLVLRADESARLASLAVPIHLVVLAKERIVGSVAEGIKASKGTNAVLITGPSRSADIEGVMVPGVHGPGDLWLFWQ